jgi:Protein of unknown function (DUF3105)
MESLVPSPRMRKWMPALIVLLVACGDDDKSGPGLSGALDGGPLLDGSRPVGSADAAQDGAAPLDPAVCAPTVQTQPVTAPAYHREGTIPYPDPPPVGGDHNPCWGSWGVHDTPLGAEHWVHNLEHGGVVYLYHCPDGCPAEVAQLTSLVKGRSLALLTSYDALPTRFAVVSWGVRMTSDCFDLASFTRFYTEHQNQGTEQISSDPPASCL